MADLADHAYAHAVAVLGAGEPALEAAAAAVRRGGRSRTAVLGHARAESLDRSAAALPPDLDGEVPDDLTELAVALAATRPSIERAVVDLEGRHGLDRAAFGRALGQSTATAGSSASTVGATWERALDPVLLAKLGPGGCDGLARVLGASATSTTAAAGGDDGSADAGAPERPPAAPAEPDVTTPATLRELLSLGPAVSDHAAGCSVCTDRLRSMVSVRTLLAQRPLEHAPAPVRAAAAPSRLRRPVAAPPLAPSAPRRSRLRRSTATTSSEPTSLLGDLLHPSIVGTFVLVLSAAGVVIALTLGEGDGGGATVEALTRVPEAGTALVATPAMVEGRAPTPVRLDNVSEDDVAWVAAPDAPWLRVVPSEGSLGPGRSTPLRLSVSSEAPEGELRGSVQITGRDGSAAVVRLATTVERAPDVAATTAACTVDATVEDEGEVAGVQLHWFEPPATPGDRPAERIEAMQATPTGFVGRLPNTTRPLTWWVTAADARGNQARTADQVQPADACP